MFSSQRPRLVMIQSQFADFLAAGNPQTEHFCQTLGLANPFKYNGKRFVQLETMHEEKKVEGSIGVGFY